jgi:hypothetical protein
MKTTGLQKSCVDFVTLFNCNLKRRLRAKRKNEKSSKIPYFYHFCNLFFVEISTFIAICNPSVAIYILYTRTGYKRNAKEAILWIFPHDIYIIYMMFEKVCILELLEPVC